MRIERARKGLCQEYEKCKEQREELNRQKIDLERKTRSEGKKVKIKKRASKAEKLIGG